MKKQHVQRIITGNDEQGLSSVIDEGIASDIVHPIPGNQTCALINLWRTQAMPAPVSDLSSLKLDKMPLAPVKNGINFRYVDFPPDSTYLHLLDNAGLEATWETLQTDQKKSLHQKKTHPLMHQTKSIDFGIVLSGEIYLILDKEERLVKEGDVVIQRATHHAWSNRSNSLCRMAFILIDAEV